MADHIRSTRVDDVAHDSGRWDIQYRDGGARTTICCTDRSAAERQVAYVEAADRGAGLPVREITSGPCRGNHPVGL